MSSKYRRAVGVVALAALAAGCAAPRALTGDGAVHLCRSFVVRDQTWSLCRTHPSVTPDVLERARARAASTGMSLPRAIAEETDCAVYGLPRCPLTGDTE